MAAGLPGLEPNLGPVEYEVGLLTSTVRRSVFHAVYLSAVTYDFHSLHLSLLAQRKRNSGRHHAMACIIHRHLDSMLCICAAHIVTSLSV
jgi:hypothetical protein